MTKSIIISERDNIAAVMEEGRVAEFFIHRGDMLLGDVYLGHVENILPSIDAAFVNVGGDKMAFLHASDVSGKGALKDKLKPKQSVLVQIMKEPTGHKGPRITMSISLPGRFLVLMPDEKGISVSRKIVSAKERSRLKSVVSLLKPAGVGVIIRTEAENQSESEIQEDLEFLLEKWNNIITMADTVTPPSLLYRDQDLLYRVIREACTEDVKDITVDTPFALHRANQLLQSWNIGTGINVSCYKGSDPLLISKGIDKEIRAALQTKVNLPSGGYLYIQTTEALTVIDVNSGKFTSSATQGETIRKTNIEAVAEIARQLRLRNIGGMIIIDFIDMDNRVDQLAVLEELEMAIEPDKSKPQVGQLSDLGLVELTRHRQGQSLAEIFTKKCPACSGSGLVIEEFNFAAPAQEGDFRAKSSKLRLTPKLNNARPKQVNEAQKTADIIKNVQAETNAQQTKKIKTSPSLVASATQKVKKPEKEISQISEMDEKSIRQTIASEDFTPNLSKVVKISAVPPKVAREYMGDNYTMDVFSILQELESSEYIPETVVKQPVQAKPVVASPIRENIPQGKPQQRHVPQPQHIRQNQQPERPVPQKPVEEEKPIQEEHIEEKNVAQSATKAPIRKAPGRKPARSSGSRSTTRSTARKKPASRPQKPAGEE